MISFNQVYVTIDLDALSENIQHTYDLCKEKNIELAVVAKSICADSRILKVIEESPAKVIADSRLDNFYCMDTKMQRLLIRPSSLADAEAAALYADISIQSSLPTVMEIEKAAEKHGIIHDILILIDLGDLRDGIYHSDRKLIMEMAEYVHKSKFLRLSGIAANYNCFSHFLPDDDNMNVMAELYHSLKSLYDVEKPIVSCGNSSAVRLLTENKYDIPPEINQYRMGEAIVLGRDPSDNTLIPGYRYDVFTLEAALIEVYEKPVDGKIMRRGVVSIGKQDLYTDHILPIDKRVKVLGACSDECVIDLSDAEEYKAGDFVKFRLEYDALMTLFAGNFFSKKYIGR